MSGATKFEEKGVVGVGIRGGLVKVGGRWLVLQSLRRKARPETGSEAIWSGMRVEKRKIWSRMCIIRCNELAKSNGYNYKEMWSFENHLLWS